MTFNKWRIIDVQSETVFEVPEIYLMFDDEKTEMHAKRIQRAVQLRNKCENRLRFEAVLDGLILDIPKPEQRVQDKIRKLLFLPFNVRWIEIFEREYFTLFQKALVTAELKKFPGKLFIPLPVEKSETKCLPLIDENCQERKEKFKKSQSYLQQIWIYSCPTAPKIMDFIHNECNKVSRMLLFDIPLHSDLNWNDLVDANVKILEEISKFFKESWVENFVQELKRQSAIASKGWLDMSVKDWDVYRISKLFHLIELIKQRMEVATVCLLRTSLRAFTTRLCEPCEPMSNIAEDFVWGPDLVGSQFLSMQPLFTIELDIVDGNPAYTSNIEEFKKQFVEMFNSRIQASHEVPQIDPQLLRNLIFPRGLKIASIGFLDDEIQTQIKIIHRSYSNCQISLRSYAREFQKFVDFKNLVVNDYVQIWKESGKTARETKTELFHQLTSIEEIELTVPTTIVIGPVNVFIPLKKDLIAKHRELYEKLLIMFKNSLKEKLEVVNQNFEEIVSKLMKRSESIEELIAVREWLPQIPSEVKKLQKDFEQMSADFEVLESFLIVLSDETMQLKVSCQMMPQDIRLITVETQLRHLNEFERLHHLQLVHEAQFLEQMEAVVDKTQSFSHDENFGEVSSISNKTNDLWSVLSEMLERGEILNSRQITFEGPEINLKPLNDSVELLRPFYDLCSMTTSFARSRESWTSSPLSSVDIIAVQEEMKRCENILHDSRIYFAANAVLKVLVEKLLNDFDDFKDSLEMMKHLKNPDFQVEQLMALFEQTGIPVEFTPEISFDWLFAQGFLQDPEIVKQISIGATRDREEKETQAIIDEKRRIEEVELMNQKKARHAVRMHIFKK